MEKRELIKKYNKGSLNQEEMKKLEQFIETGEINLEELEGWTEWMERTRNIKDPYPSKTLDQNFYNWLEKQNSVPTHSTRKITLHFQWWQGVAAAIIFLVGIGIGFWLDKEQKYQEQLSDLTEDMHRMQEIMMFTLLKEGSASDRLKAVNYTTGIPELSEKIITELLYTLNHDENINVRIATVEALGRYANNPKVREGLIKSINQQQPPLVQMSLVELMVAIREKSAVTELQKLLEKNNLAPEVKDKVEEGINVLI